MNENSFSRLPIVGVMGSGRFSHNDLAEPLGAWLAAQDVHLLTGGGGGVMESVSRAFVMVKKRRGLVIGILPGDGTDHGCRPKPGYPNPFVEVPITTHLPLSGDRGMEAMSRNHINILSATVIVALPGGDGTSSEILLAKRYGRPLIAFLHDRREIPGLASGIPLSTDLDAIKHFILRHIAIREA